MKYRYTRYLLFLILLPFYTYADYLVVSRSSTIKEQPQRRAKTLEKADKGDTLALLDSGVQQNGYYHVIGSTTGKDGWIYRTLVRRYEGEFPSQPACDPDNITVTGITYQSTIPSGYYNGTENLSGTQLKTALYNIIKGHTEFEYTSDGTDVWDILKETDKVPACPEYVKLLYTNRMRLASEEYNNGLGWTREHVWAKSHGEFGTTKGAGTDVHHLRPVDTSVNSARNKKDFDNGGDEYMDDNYPTGCKRDVDSWEPRNSEKGDIARMLFYMAVRYEGQNGEPDLEMADNVNTSPAPLHGKLSTLLQWHILDPVDNWEKRRNDIIYIDFQHNRNPFIDHPEYVEKIWGGL